MQRRTQQERRETTIRALLDAAIDALVEDGYAEASVQKICARTELSHGALFRHFATREALMVAVGEDVGARLLESYRRKFVALKKNDGDVLAAMLLLRETCRSRLNQAWYELTVAARTHEQLRKGLEPVARRYFESITELARELLPELARKLGDSFDQLVILLVCMFDGESLHRFVKKDPHGDEARLAILDGAVKLLETRNA